MCERENCGMSMCFSWLCGAIIGGILGLLFAPQSGKRTRQSISNFIEDMQDKGKDMIDKGEDFIEKQKNKIIK